MQRYLLIIILFISFLNSAAAAVTATVDRQKIAVNEPFTLIYDVDSNISIMPNFSILEKDFDILDQNQSSKISVVNGNVDKKTLLKLTLAPKRVGTLTIPAINFEQAKSNSIRILVTEPSSVASDVKEIQLEVTVDTLTPYVQQQVIVTIKLHRLVNTAQESISELKLSHQDVFLEPLFKDYKKYQSTRAGRQSITYEMKYALFPQKTGPLIIERVIYNALIPSSQSGGSFDSFFGKASGKPVRELSKALTLDVREKPQKMKNRHWLPAEKVTLKGELSDDLEQISVGDTVTYTIYITANGQPASALPTLNLSPIQNAKTYPDQANEVNHTAENSYLGQRTEKIAIVPTAVGSLRLPEVEIEWWNTQTDQLETVRLPEKVVQIKPAPFNEQVNKLSDTTPAQEVSVSSSDNKWKIVTLIIGLGWLLTICTWVYAAYFRNRKLLVDKVVGGQSLSTLKTTVKKTCQRNQAQSARKALISWAQKNWSTQKLNNLDGISSLVKDAQFTAAINGLQNHLYSSNRNDEWQGQSLLEAFNQLKMVSLAADDITSHLLFKIS